MPPTTIREIQFYRARSTRSISIADATHRISDIAFVVTRIELVTGVIGWAYLLSFHYSPRAIAGALQDAREIALGCDASRPGVFLERYNREAEYFGQTGLQRWASASINIAMWDAWARTLRQPVWRVFGAVHDRVPLYGSGGWLSYSQAELLDEVTGYVRRGFKAVKIKVGSPEVAEDVERLTRVREAVGNGIRVMMDANQGMTLPAALELAEAVRPLRITWFEEPLPHTDFEGYAHLRQRAGMSLAMGEREFDTVALRELIARKGIDLWQPDLLRLGSVEAWRDSAALAAAYNIPTLPHYYKEYDVPLLVCTLNVMGAESFDWVDDLITSPIRMEGGFAYPTEAPGWGFDFKEEFLTAL
jgi:L-alanine-DL-glutamate epimerase-like enolase superfamily enzyme